MALTKAQIDLMYEEVLSRHATSAEQAAFSSLANSETTAQIELDIATLPEATQLVDTLVRLYQGAFGRLPDSIDPNGNFDTGAQSGLWVNTNALRAGLNLVQMAQAFVASAEFLAQYGSIAVTPALITALYEHILGRDPSSQEVANWQALNLDAAHVLLGFTQSAEFIARSQPSVDQFKVDLANGLHPSGPLPPPPAQLTLTSDHDIGGVNEGQTVTYTLQSTNPADVGKTFSWNIAGAVSAADIVGGQLTGSVKLDAQGLGHVAVTLVNDHLTEGPEAMTLSFGALTDALVVVNDTSVNPTFTLTSNRDGTHTVQEGQGIDFTLQTDPSLAGKSFAYTITGTVSGADILGGGNALTGTVVIDNNGQAVIHESVLADNLTEGTETLTLNIAGQSDTIQILDTSTTPTVQFFTNTVGETLTGAKGAGTQFIGVVDTVIVGNNTLSNVVDVAVGDPTVQNKETIIIDNTGGGQVTPSETGVQTLTIPFNNGNPIPINNGNQVVPVSTGVQTLEIQNFDVIDQQIPKALPQLTTQKFFGGLTQINAQGMADTVNIISTGSQTGMHIFNLQNFIQNITIQDSDAPGGLDMDVIMVDALTGKGGAQTVNLINGGEVFLVDETTSGNDVVKSFTINAKGLNTLHLDGTSVATSIVLNDSSVNDVTLFRTVDDSEALTLFDASGTKGTVNVRDIEADEGNTLTVKEGTGNDFFHIDVEDGATLKINPGGGAGINGNNTAHIHFTADPNGGNQTLVINEGNGNDNLDVDRDDNGNFQSVTATYGNGNNNMDVETGNNSHVSLTAGNGNNNIYAQVLDPSTVDVTLGSGSNNVTVDNGEGAKTTVTAGLGVSDGDNTVTIHTNDSDTLGQPEPDGGQIYKVTLGTGTDHVNITVDGSDPTFSPGVFSDDGSLPFSNPNGEPDSVIAANQTITVALGKGGSAGNHQYASIETGVNSTVTVTASGTNANYDDVTVLADNDLWTMDNKDEATNAGAGHSNVTVTLGDSNNNVNVDTDNTGFNFVTKTYNDNGSVIKVSTGTGNDTVNVNAGVNADINVALGDGTNTATITADSKIVVTGGSGVDTVTVNMNGGPGSSSADIQTDGGNDDIIVNGATGNQVKVLAGEGNDQVEIDSLQNAGIILDGGNGTDILGVTSASAANGFVKASVQGFEILEIEDQLVNNIDLQTDFHGDVNQVILQGGAGGGVRQISGFTQDGILVYEADSPGATVWAHIANSPFNVSDKLNIVLDADSTGTVDFGTLQSDALEHLTITSTTQHANIGGEVNQIRYQDLGGGIPPSPTVDITINHSTGANMPNDGITSAGDVHLTFTGPAFTTIDNVFAQGFQEGIDGTFLGGVTFNAQDQAYFTPGTGDGNAHTTSNLNFGGVGGNDIVTLGAGDHTVSLDISSSTNNTLSAKDGANTVTSNTTGTSTVTLGTATNTDFNSYTDNKGATAGVDTVTINGSGGFQVTTGGAVDVITVGTGGGDITAGKGGDSITLGAGVAATTLHYAATTDSGFTLGDIVKGFQQGLDKLDFSAIHATTSDFTYTEVNGAVAVNAAIAGDAAGKIDIVLDKLTGDVYIDWNGDHVLSTASYAAVNGGTNDMQITLVGVNHLTGVTGGVLA